MHRFPDESVRGLAEQYLAFVEEARRLRLEIAADYLVMAAWLAYLKSRLLLPKPEQPKAEEAPAEEVAARLAFRLAKLEAMRNGPSVGAHAGGSTVVSASRETRHTERDGVAVVAYEVTS